VQKFLRQGRPAISVDTKKKEQVGDCKYAGREWQPKGEPELVQVHDFGKVRDSTYGVYDLGQDVGLGQCWHRSRHGRFRGGEHPALVELADETGLEISVCHFPPGTSKWNKIEHRLFSFITQNWRGRPLVSHEAIVNLIAATTTKTGLQVKSQLDTGKYPKGVKVSKKEFAAIGLRPDTFHGEWNYTIEPHANDTVIS
jgi:Rhodopirellula transposase DDE domain